MTFQALFSTILCLLDSKALPWASYQCDLTGLINSKLRVFFDECEWERYLDSLNFQESEQNEAWSEVLRPILSRGRHRLFGEFGRIPRLDEIQSLTWNSCDSLFTDEDVEEISKLLP